MESGKQFRREIQSDLKYQFKMLNSLLDEIEDRFRAIIREEIDAALLEMNNPKSQKVEVKPIIKNSETFPELLTASQVADLLGVKAARIYELTRERERYNFPVIIIGVRSYRYSKKAISEWLEKN